MDSPKRMAKSITGRKDSTGPVRLIPNKWVGVAPLDHRHQDPEGRPDGQQVHHGADERDHETTEDDRQQDERQDHHQGDEERELGRQDVGEVHEDGGVPPDQDFTPLSPTAAGMVSLRR